MRLRTSFMTASKSKKIARGRTNPISALCYQMGWGGERKERGPACVSRNYPRMSATLKIDALYALDLIQFAHKRDGIRLRLQAHLPAHLQRRALPGGRGRGQRRLLQVLLEESIEEFVLSLFEANADRKGIVQGGRAGRGQARLHHDCSQAADGQ